MKRFFLAIAACLLAAAQILAADWPQFRGPRGDGSSDSLNLPTQWDALGGIEWKAEIPGQGWSSPIVASGRVWLTSAEQTALTTAQREKRLAAGFYQDFADQFQAHGTVTLYAVEVDLQTGARLRTIELFTNDNPRPIHATNTYASPTPVTDGERLYCHFGSLGTVAVDIQSGKVLWNERFVVDEITGPGGSPVLWNDRLIFSCDGADQQFVIALDKLTGRTIWKTPRPPMITVDAKQRRAFCTPLVVSHGGRDEVIAPGAQWVVSYDPASGGELWRVNFGDGHATIPRPVHRDGVVYVCTGFMKPQLWAIRLGGAGEVTHTHVLWKHEKQVPEISSPIAVGDELYFVSTLGVATCLDAASGAVHWQQRLGGNYSASPIAGVDKLYFTSREGITTVVRCGRIFEELNRNQLFGQTLASAAVAGDRILMRADRTLYCLRKSLDISEPQPNRP
jgi:outer membrane protein assembly factor BamB